MNPDEKDAWVLSSIENLKNPTITIEDKKALIQELSSEGITFSNKQIKDFLFTKPSQTTTSPKQSFVSKQIQKAVYYVGLTSRPFNYYQPTVKTFTQVPAILNVLKDIFDTPTKNFVSVQELEFQKNTICIVFEKFTWKEERYVLIQSPNSSGDIVYLLKAHDIENYDWAGIKLEDYLELESLYKEKHQYDMRLEICKFLLPQINTISDFIYNNPLSLVSSSLFAQLITRANMDNITRKYTTIEDTTQDVGGNSVTNNNETPQNSAWDIANFWENNKNNIHTGISGGGEFGLYSFAGQKTLRPWIYGRMSNLEFFARLAATVTSVQLQKVMYQMQYPIASFVVEKTGRQFVSQGVNWVETSIHGITDIIYEQLKDINGPHKSIMTKMKFEKDLHKLAIMAAETNNNYISFWDFLETNQVYLSENPFDIGVLLNEFKERYPDKFNQFKGTDLYKEIKDVTLEISPEVFEFQYQKGTNSEDIIMLDALQEKSRFNKYIFNSDDHFILTLLGTKLSESHIQQLQDLWIYDLNDNRVGNSLYSTVGAIRSLAINRIRLLKQCLLSKSSDIENIFKEGSIGLTKWKSEIGTHDLPEDSTSFLHVDFKQTENLLDNNGIFNNYAGNMNIYNGLEPGQQRQMEQYMIDQGSKIIKFLTENTDIPDTDKYILFAGKNACMTAKTLDQDIADAYGELTKSRTKNTESPAKPSMPIDAVTGNAKTQYMQDTDIDIIVDKLVDNDTSPQPLNENEFKDDFNIINTELTKVIKNDNYPVDKLKEALENGKHGRYYTGKVIKYYETKDPTLSEFLGGLTTVQTVAETNFKEAYEKHEKEPSKENLKNLQSCYDKLPPQKQSIYTKLVEKLSEINTEKRWLKTYYEKTLKQWYAFFTPRNIIFFPNLAAVIVWLYHSTLGRQKIDLQLFRRALFAYQNK